MVQRVQYRRHCSYNTAGNKIKLVKTPGGKLSTHLRRKRVRGPHCPAFLGRLRLQGTTAERPSEHTSTQKVSVTRPYGGVLTSEQLRERITRAFLIEECKIVKKVMKAQSKIKRAQQKKKKASRRRLRARQSKLNKGTGRGPKI
eukprot:gene10379-3194_t